MKLNFAKIMSAIWLFLSGAKSFIKTYVIPAIHWIELIKSFVTGHSAESDLVRTILKKIFPALDLTGINDKVNEYTAHLATAIRNLLPDQAFSKDSVSDADCVQGLIAYLTTLDQNTVNGLYLSLAAALARVTSGDTTSSDHHIQTVTQVAYAHVKNDNTIVQPVEGSPIIIPFAKATAASTTLTPAQKRLNTIAAKKISQNGQASKPGKADTNKNV